MNWVEFLTIATAHLFAVASPGPDFAVVVRQSVTAGTRAGIWTSLGVGAGILVHVSYCLLGVALVLATTPNLLRSVKLMAAAYLIYLGVQSIRASFKPQMHSMELTGVSNFTPRKAFIVGFLTNGLNPKATLFFLALFTVVINPSTPLGIQIGYGIYLALATFAWFAMLSRLLGKQHVRQFLLLAGAWFERGMGLVLLLVAAQLLI